jgi:hypothetical protein
VVRNRDWRFWASLCVLVPALVVLTWDVAVLCRDKVFVIDEFQYAHAAYAIAQGQIPYRDFFEVHFPLNYQLLSLLARVAGSDPLMIVAMRLAMLGWGAITLAAAFFLVRARSAAPALVAPIVLLSATPLWDYAHEIRHDPVGLATLLLAVAFLELRGPDRRAALLSGLAFGLCLWSTQKALFYGGLVLGVPFLLDAWRRLRGKPAWFVRDVLAFGLGAAMVLLAALGWLWLHDALGGFWQYCFVWAERYQREYPHFAWQRYFVPQALAMVWTAPLFVAGVCVLALELWRDWAANRRNVLLLVALPATFLSFSLQQAPWPYSAVPFWGIYCVVAARGALGLWRSISKDWGRARFIVGVGGPLLLVPGVGLAGYEAHQHYRWTVADRDNAEQRAVLEQLDVLTDARQAIYDNSGSYVARPHAYFYFYTDSMMRLQMAAQLTVEIPKALREREVVAVVCDARFGGLPPGLRHFLETNYQKYSGDLWLYGKRLQFDAAGTASFTAVTTGVYFVAMAGRVPVVRVDGAAVDPNRMQLERGEHLISFAEPAAEAFVLWLPKSGEHWRPKPTAMPAFSTVF